MSCLVCEGTDLEKILFMYSPYNPKFFNGVAICRDCGHIQVHPLFSEDEYKKINGRFFGDQYMVDGKQNMPNNAKKLKELDDRLSPYIREGMNVLDVGAGEGWSMDYFKQRKCNYFAIETVARLADSIHERGGKIIGKTIFDDCSDHEEYFDIIVFRMVLEHMLNPKESLLILKNMLKPTGFMYLILPNTANPSLKKGFRVSFLRPVHISYFCLGNLLRLANSVGLKSCYSEAKGLIYCLLQKGIDNSFKQHNYYTKQKEIFLTAGKRSLVNDSISILKNLPKAVMRRMF